MQDEIRRRLLQRKRHGRARLQTPDSDVRSLRASIVGCKWSRRLTMLWKGEVEVLQIHYLLAKWPE